MSLTTNVTVSLRAVLTNALDLSTPKDDLSLSFTDELESGTAIDQADKVFHDSRTISGSSSETLDLAGSLTDGLGVTVTFAKVKLIYIENTSTTAANILTVGNATSNQFVGPLGGATQTIAVPPGGVWLSYTPSLAGWTVTGGSADQLKIANGGSTSTTYKIILVGTSA